MTLDPVPSPATVHPPPGFALRNFDKEQPEADRQAWAGAILGHFQQLPGPVFHAFCLDSGLVCVFAALWQRWVLLRSLISYLRILIYT